VSVATIDLKRIKADKSVKKEVLEVYTYLKIYMEQKERQDWLKRRKKAWKAIENEMWDDKEKGEMAEAGQVPLVINKCNKGVQGSCAIVTDQKPEIKFYPVGSSDLYVAELLKRAHDVVWVKNSGNDVTYDVVEESKIGAIGFFEAHHDPSKGLYGRIVNGDEPPDDIYWDKDSRARDMSDTHIIKAKTRTKSYILENYDEITEKELYFEQDIKGDSGTSTGVTGKDNYKEQADQTPDTKGPIYQEPENIWEIEAWMLKKVKEHWVVITDEKTGAINPIRMQFKRDPSREEAEAAASEQGGEYWPRLIEKRYQRIVVGKKLIAENINPLGEDIDGDPVMSLIPLPHQKTRTSYPMSPTNYAQPINKEKNKRRAQFIYAASQNVNAPIIQPAGKYSWSGNAGTPGSIVDVDGSASFLPQRLSSGTFDIHRFVELEQLADKDIDDQYDLHDVMRGKIPQGQANIAGRTVLALQDLGGMMSKPFLRKLEAALIKLGKVNMTLILRHWPREMWERLLEDNEKPPGESEEATIDPAQDPNIQAVVAEKYLQALERIRPKDPTQPPGISLLDLDVRITAGSSMPTNRMAKEQIAIEKVGAGIYDAEAALEYADDPLKDKVVARLKKQAEMGLMQPQKK
jgi:hypothetical protein